MALKQTSRALLAPFMALLLEAPCRRVLQPRDPTSRKHARDKSRIYISPECVADYYSTHPTLCFLPPPPLCLSLFCNSLHLFLSKINWDYREACILYRRWRRACNNNDHLENKFIAAKSMLIIISIIPVSQLVVFCW